MENYSNGRSLREFNDDEWKETIFGEFATLANTWSLNKANNPTWFNDVSALFTNHGYKVSESDNDNILLVSSVLNNNKEYLPITTKYGLPIDKVNGIFYKNVCREPESVTDIICSLNIEVSPLIRKNSKSTGSLMVFENVYRGIIRLPYDPTNECIVSRTTVYGEFPKFNVALRFPLSYIGGALNSILYKHALCYMIYPFDDKRWYILGDEDIDPSFAVDIRTELNLSMKLARRSARLI